MAAYGRYGHQNQEYGGHGSTAFPLSAPNFKNLGLETPHQNFRPAMEAAAAKALPRMLECYQVERDDVQDWKIWRFMRQSLSGPSSSAALVRWVIRGHAMSFLSHGFPILRCLRTLNTAAIRSTLSVAAGKHNDFNDSQRLSKAASHIRTSPGSNKYKPPTTSEHYLII